MSEAKHTPGPWRFDVETCSVRTDNGYHGQPIARVTKGDHIGNGAILAAAPALADALAACVEALQWCSGSSDFAPEGQARLGWERGPMVALEAARAALTAAGR